MDQRSNQCLIRLHLSLTSLSLVSTRLHWSLIRFTRLHTSALVPHLCGLVSSLVCNISNKRLYPMNFCFVNFLCLDIAMHIQITTFYFSKQVFGKSDHKGGNTKQFNSVAITFDVNHNYNWQVLYSRRSCFIFGFSFKLMCKTIWERFFIFTIITSIITLIFIK